MQSPRVAIYPADLGGCGHYRLIWPARALQAEGADIDLVLPNEPQERQIQAQWYDTEDDPVLVDVVAPEADIVVIQRPIDRARAEAVALLQDKGIRVVIEIDDDFDAIHPRNVAWPKLQPKLNPHRNREWLHRACEQADMVVVSTPALAGIYGRHGRVRVVRNCVPARYLDVTRDPQDGLYVGWSGSIETHPDDLQVMGPALAKVLRSTGAEMAVVGTGNGVRQATGIDNPPLACGWRPIAEYPEVLATFDVGVVPLTLSRFNQAKSYLKGLEMAAVGVPFVASETDEYMRLAALGAGLLADKPRRWGQALRRLLGSPEERDDIAGRGREVARELTVQGNAWRWWGAWSAALDREAVPA